MAQTLFVSRHAGALDWLRAHHPELAEACRHVTHATPADLAGNIVIGDYVLVECLDWDPDKMGVVAKVFKSW